MSKFSSAAVATTLWQFDTWVNHHPRRKEMFTIWCHWYKNSKVLHTEKKAIHFGSDSPTHTWHERYITSYNTCLLCTLVAQLTAGSFLKHILTCSYWYTYGVEPRPRSLRTHVIPCVSSGSLVSVAWHTYVWTPYRPPQHIVGLSNGLVVTSLPVADEYWMGVDITSMEEASPHQGKRGCTLSKSSAAPLRPNWGRWKKKKIPFW